ncbi:phage virion morphogenesis protein, partial [Escherichia coli]|nr:phage virion morphogenesis protein [Escherichia coli]
PLRAKTGRIKRTMFQKLRTSRYMKATGRENSAVVEFTGKVQRIARIHHFGLMDSPNKYSREIVYSKREMLGFSEVDKNIVERLVINHIQ